MTRARLEELLNRMVEGSLTDDERAEVRARLLESPQARRLYYDLLAIDCLLTDRFRMPEYTSLRAKAMEGSWMIRRIRNRFAFVSVAAASILLLVTAFVFLLLKLPEPQAIVEGSPDSRYFSGSNRAGEVLKVGEELSVERGVVRVGLTSRITASFEGPAQARLLDKKGNIELIAGRGFFDIAAGGKGFEIHCGQSVIRDIGTRFGVDARDNGSFEVHVGDGEVEVTPRHGSAHRVNSGRAMAHRPTGEANGIDLDLERFVQTLPWQRVVFADNFERDAGHGTALHRPQIGKPWLVAGEGSVEPLVFRDGVLDTSFGQRSLTANFDRIDTARKDVSYIVTFSTRKPSNEADRSLFPFASERLLFYDSNGRQLFSVSAHSAENHRWRLHDETSPASSPLTEIEAFDQRTLTLLYESRSGRVVLHEGASVQEKELVSLTTAPGASLGAVNVLNQGGGDLALEDLTARVVVYPRRRHASR